MIEIKILFTDNCQHYLSALKVIENTLKELSLRANIIKVLVTTLDEAKDLKFLGSPTIQVNGLDIEPQARRVEQFGLS